MIPPARRFIGILATALLCLIPSASPGQVSPAAEGASVRIFAFFQKGEDDIAPASGSGFIVSSQGHIVTNDHVIAGDPDSGDKLAPLLYFVCRKEKESVMAYVATPDSILGRWKDNDLAVLKIDGLAGSEPYPLSRVEQPKGSHVHTLGYPGLADSDPAVESTLIGLVRSLKPGAKKLDLTSLANSSPEIADLFNPSYVGGTINKTSLAPLVDGGANVRLIQHSTPISEGNSGGPLYNDCGQIVGVIQSYRRNAQGRSISFSPSIVELERVFKESSIPVQWIDRPCLSSGGGGSDKSLPLPAAVALAVTGGLAVVALLVALFRSPGGRRVVNRVSQIVGPRVPRVPPYPPSIPGPPPPPGPRRLIGTLSGDLGGKDFVLPIYRDQFAGPRFLMLIGREADLNDATIPDPSVSRQHLQLRLEGGGLLIADRNGTNRLGVNRVPLDHPFHEIPLHDGDTIQIGKVELVYRASTGP